MRFYIETLGCPKNQVDSEMMATILQDAGHVQVEDPSEADALIVNTCGFIAPARDESCQVLQELARTKSDDQFLIAAGCMPQRYEEEVLRCAPEVDGLIGTQTWPEISDLFEKLARSGRTSNRPTLIREAGRVITSVPREAVMGATAYLKIADGCDAACGYCTIPAIKGPQRSKPPQDVVREARELDKQGVQEIVLIAQDTTAYGRDLGKGHGLANLLRRIAKAVPDLPWLRIMYAYPQHVTPRLVHTMATLDPVCHYLDMPLQHGHPDVLRRMRRPHDLDAVRKTIALLRDAMPDISLRSTFIVGYPGETEQEFQALLSFMEEIAFDKVGIFAFSAEAGTYAATLPDHVSPEVIAHRYDRAMTLQQEISLARNQEQIGWQMAVLIEGAGDGITVGRSYRDAPEVDGLVLIEEELPVGTFQLVEIVGANEYDLIGQPV
jgi:ribosomal protein S12 methylthiotransferase